MKGIHIDRKKREQQNTNLAGKVGSNEFQSIFYLFLSTNYQYENCPILYLHDSMLMFVPVTATISSLLVMLWCQRPLLLRWNCAWAASNRPLHQLGVLKTVWHVTPAIAKHIPEPCNPYTSNTNKSNE